MTHAIILGLLNACTPQDEEEFDSWELPVFSEFFDQVEHNITLIEYRITEGTFPSQPAECDAYLITGSPKGVYDADPWIAQLGDFIRHCYAQRVKLVGICFGHQILAHALGGHAAKSPGGWGVGRSTVTIGKRRAWMSPPLPQGAFYFCHQDQVVHLPQEGELLAGNSFCPNGMFAIGNRVLGMQAHPEFTGKIVQTAIDWVRPQLTDERLRQVRAATEGQPVDNSTMAQWIVNFLCE